MASNQEIKKHKDKLRLFNCWNRFMNEYPECEAVGLKDKHTEEMIESAFKIGMEAQKENL